jgi:hypothetical protein
MTPAIKIKYLLGIDNFLFEVVSHICYLPYIHDIKTYSIMALKKTQALLYQLVDFDQNTLCQCAYF